MRKLLRNWGLISGALTLAFFISLIPTQYANAASGTQTDANFCDYSSGTMVRSHNASVEWSTDIGSFSNPHFSINIGPYESIPAGMIEVYCDAGTGDGQGNGILSYSFTLNGYYYSGTINMQQHPRFSTMAYGSVISSYPSGVLPPDEAAEQAKAEQAKAEQAKAAQLEQAARVAATEKFVKDVTSSNTSGSYSYGKVTATSETGALPAGGVLTMGKPSDADYARADAALIPVIGNAQKTIWEINLNDLNGSAVHQLNGTVTVSVEDPITVAPGNTIAVYWINGDQAVRLPSYRQGGRTFFDVDHFSTFAFVEVSGPDNKVVGAAPKSPKTGEMPIGIILLALSAGSLAGIFALRKMA